MARRSFHLPNAPSDDRPAERSQDAISLVGGSLEKRRAHGHPSNLEGHFLHDPIFVPDDLQKLQQWCDSADRRPLAIEIGFQRARFAAQWCLQNPDARYLGFEVRKKFCEDADAWLFKHDVNNAKLALVDARSVLEDLTAPDSVDLLFCFYPDPWWKKRHMKKRLVSRSFAEAALRVLKPGGALIVKTDVEGYAEWAQAELEQVVGWTVTRLADATAGLPLTQRERRCHLRDLPTWAIEARKQE